MSTDLLLCTPVISHGLTHTAEESSERTRANMPKRTQQFRRREANSSQLPRPCLAVRLLQNPWLSDEDDTKLWVPVPSLPSCLPCPPSELLILYDRISVKASLSFLSRTLLLSPSTHLLRGKLDKREIKGTMFLDSGRFIKLKVPWKLMQRQNFS